MSSESERLELCKECTHTCVVGTEYESESCDLQRGKSTPPDVICSMCSEGSEEGNPTVGDHRFGICLDCHTRTGRVFAATSDTQPLKPSGGAVDAPDPGAINRRVRCIRAALETVDEFAHPGVVSQMGK